MWTVSLKDGQSELNDLRRNKGTNEQTMEQTKEGTNTSRDRLTFIIYKKGLVDKLYEYILCLFNLYACYCSLCETAEL